MKTKQEGWSYTDKKGGGGCLFGFNPIKWNPISSVQRGP